MTESLRQHAPGTQPDRDGTGKGEDPIRALVVEDDPSFRLLLEAVLTRRGLEATLCEDAERGLEEFQKEPFELALLDNYLPGMTGVEFAGKIRELEGGEKAMILLITGDERMETLEAALDAGANDYVTKPATPAYLTIRVAIAERLIRQERAHRAALEEASKNALTDSLTGLATRALLLDRIQGGINRSAREADYLFGVLHLDLDGFHRVNERLGKKVGDRVLVEVGRRLEASVRLVDTPARLAADEFAVFLDDLRDGSDVARVTNRIRERLAEPVRLGEHTIFIGATMGIALGDPQYLDGEEVFRDAAKALRRAKSEGSGSIRIFDPVLHEEASERVRREEEIRQALEKDEMVLHYQPILDLSSPRIVGLEALIRWPRPDGSFVPAGEFIPLAEQSGLVAHMGWWTLERACGQLVEWHRRFPGTPPVAVMVNVPGRQFSEPELIPSVVRILDETGLSADHLHLEITETSAMEDLDRSLSTLNDLQEVGVHVHVDDFGTGYSSLSYLHRLPVDSLKVDRSFVSGVTSGPENLAIVRTIVELAKGLRLSVVAEGIETPAQLALLQELKCDYGQGWLFSKALEPARVQEVLREPDTILGAFDQKG